MRESFESGLHAYNDALISEESGGKTHGSVEHELDRLARKVARGEETFVSTQKEIVDLQEKKREAMQLLHTRLEAIDNPDKKEPQVPGTKFAKYDNGKFIVKVGERQIPLTVGDVMADVEWGYRYALDPKTTPREIRKKYALALARYDISDLADFQIMINEQKSEKNDAGLKHIYSSIEDERKSGHLTFGHIAEKMVRAYLTKLSIDNPDVGFTVERTDVEADIEQVDFLIHIAPKTRGVSVTTGPRTRDAGIQFTTKTTEELLGEKQENIDLNREKYAEDYARMHIEDVVLVSIPIHEFAPAYDKWNAKKTPGGPDKFWDSEIKQDIFRHVLEGLLRKEEIEARIQAMQPQERHHITESNRLAA